MIDGPDSRGPGLFAHMCGCESLADGGYVMCPILDFVAIPGDENRPLPSAYRHLASAGPVGPAIIENMRPGSTTDIPYNDDAPR